MDGLLITNILLLIVVIFITLLIIALLVLAFFAIKVFRNIFEVSEKAKKEIDLVLEDSQEVRAFMKHELMSMTSHATSKAEKASDFVSSIPFKALALMGVGIVNNITKKKK